MTITFNLVDGKKLLVGTCYMPTKRFEQADGYIFYPGLLRKKIAIVKNIEIRMCPHLNVLDESRKFVNFVMPKAFSSKEPDLSLKTFLLERLCYKATIDCPESIDYAKNKMIQEVTNYVGQDYHKNWIVVPISRWDAWKSKLLGLLDVNLKKISLLHEYEVICQNNNTHDCLEFLDGTGSSFTDRSRKTAQSRERDRDFS